MIDRTEYVQAVRKIFSFISEEFGVTDINEKIRGNAFYEVQFQTTSKVISISYENIEDYLQIIIFKLKNGKLPDYDDKTQTLHLIALNKDTFYKACKADIELNNQYFSILKVDTAFERKLLKSAKDLWFAMKLLEDVRVSSPAPNSCSPK